jgi:hypothetical protein
MLPFQDATLTPAGDWRHIGRFGRNMASCKFALGRALLNLCAERRTVRLRPRGRDGERAGPLDAVLDEGRDVPEEWPTAARSRQLAAGVYRGDLM